MQLHVAKGQAAYHSVQVVVQGIPWKYTWRELKPLFEECGAINRADVAFGRDGRSRVSPCAKAPTAPSMYHRIDFALSGQVSCLIVYVRVALLRVDKPDVLTELMAFEAAQASLLCLHHV